MQTDIERHSNRETMRHLRNIVMDKRAIDEWSREVPLVQRIMNSMVHSSTGVRPSSIVYSSEIDPSIFRNTETIIDTEDIEKMKEGTQRKSTYRENERRHTEDTHNY